MGVICELLGHSFQQPQDAEPARSSDGALMVHAWSCKRCRAITETYEPMDAFIQRVADWARQSGGSVLSPPDGLGPPRPGKFPPSAHVRFGVATGGAAGLRESS